MTRSGYLLLACLLVLSLGTFAYAETEVMQDDSAAYASGAFTSQAIGDGSYVREAYTGITPADPDDFINDSATRVFLVGQTINLYARYVLDSERTYTLYWIVANGGGQIVFFNSFNATGTGALLARQVEVSLDPGTYLLNIVIIGDGVTMMSPTPFVFVVELLF